MSVFACRPNLLVRDLSASLRFYAEVLGFRVGWRWSDPKGQFMDDTDDPGTSIVGLDEAQILLTQKPGEHTTWLHFDVDTAEEVDALFEKWSARGAVIAEPPVVRAWGMYEMRLHDPDGNVLRVSSPPRAT